MMMRKNEHYYPVIFAYGEYYKTAKGNRRRQEIVSGFAFVMSRKQIPE